MFRDGFWANLSVVTLMVLVLVVAGTLSAVTAMKFAIQGTEVSVPDLRGLMEPEADAVLDAEGLELVVDGRRFSPDVAEGEILDQRPAPAARVKQDRRVRVRVSLGERAFPVPDLISASLRSSQLLLTQRGLTLGSTLYAHASDGEAGAVLFQEPSAGAREDDPAVTVLVSLGPIEQYFVMPMMTGMTVGEARARVRTAGFRLAEVPETETLAPREQVVNQHPSPGHRVSKNDTIVLGVSQ